MNYKQINETFNKIVDDNKVLIWLNQKCKQCNYCNNCIFCKLFKQIFIIEDYIELFSEKPEIFKSVCPCLTKYTVIFNNINCLIISKFL